jgi:integrase
VYQVRKRKERLRNAGVSLNVGYAHQSAVDSPDDSEWCKLAGVKRVNSHAFRHSAATHMLENGADIRVIQKLLGHASIVTTEIYTQVAIRKVKTVHANTHPRA